MICFMLGQRLHILKIAVDGGGEAVVGDERAALTSRQAGLSTPRHQARMDVLAGPAPHFSPLEISWTSITPLAPRLSWTAPVLLWLAEGMKMPAALPSAAARTSGVASACGKLRSDLFLALGDEDQIDRKLDPGGLERLTAVRKAISGVLVDRAAADDRLALARPVDDPRLERRGGPLAGS